MRRVKVFKASINAIEAEINDWAEANGARIVATSLTYDEGAGMGYVFALVTWEPLTAASAADR